MNTFQVLFLLAAGLSVAHSQESNALNQFRSMILCVLPRSWPISDYADYGCYCGKGGSGTPVDDLDRCCQVHDQCYEDARKCHPFFTFYSHRCDDNKVSCGSDNNACEMFICECDRKAAECFGVSPYNPEHKHLPSDRCQAAECFGVSPSNPEHEHLPRDRCHRCY